MADNKPQPQLNTTNYRRPSRGTRCCCCLFGLIWKLLIFIIILVLLIILVSYIILQPRSFKFHVTQANLTKFDYVNSTLRYNLVLNFTVRNPNKKLGIYFDKAEGNALYQGSRFATTSLRAPWFSYLLHTKSTVPMSVVFSGQKVVVLNVDDFQRDKSEGTFDIDVKIYFEIRFRIGNFIANNMINKARAKCGINVPLSGANGSTVGVFEPTECEVDF